ncbi:MAG: SH3 domain-containing protein [Elusimicrobia bacterium]|nr:SH3 domain-containing protein [Elusimicrobiota bacterium]
MNKKIFVIQILILFLVVNVSFAKSKRVKETGINYTEVKISKKNVEIKNPVSLIYRKTSDKVVFEDNTPKQLKTEGYWISKLSEPDKIILDKKQIIQLNKDIFDLHLGIANMKGYPETVSRERLEKTFKQTSSYITKKNYLNEYGEHLFPDFFITLDEKIDLPEGDTTNVRFAITTKYNDVRLLPTSQKIISSKNSKDIDRLQEESIDLGTPVIVLCQTKDKQWCYVMTPTEEGWIQTENIAFTDRKTFNKWIEMKKPVVVTDPKADIFLDKERTNFLEYARMGAKFPYAGKKGTKYVCVNIPTSDSEGNLVLQKGYLNFKDVNVGYLPYTQRNALILAFNHLNSPYGWGGSNGEQDCSGYLGQIFNCFGILLPETSVQKIKCGQVTKLNKKDDDTIKNDSIIETGIPGISFVYLSGHIMLYIGHEDNKPYVIQCIWGVTSYTEKNEKTVNYINKTIVSNLEIGSEVAGNSLIDRVSKFNVIK